MTTQRFHIGHLLSVTTGQLLTPQPDISGVYEILNHMTGDSLMTHQLPLAADAMTPELIQQHPWLEGLMPPAKDDETLMSWMAEVAQEHGEHHDVESAPLAWGTHDPIQDLHNEFPDTPVIGVVLPPGDEP